MWKLSGPEETFKTGRLVMRRKKMRILKDQAIGVLIDVQEKLAPHIHGIEAVVSRQQVLIKGMQVLGVPLLVTEQYTKGLGATLPQLQENLSHYRPMEKMAFSCLDDPVFEEALKESGRKAVILSGIETHVCVLQTVLDLLEDGYQPVVIEDCVSSRKESDKLIALSRMEKEGAVISSVESILFELCRISGTETFKQISRLVK
jgi:nicotinamidase-related amidase